jgi:hypothetical protein
VGREDDGGIEVGLAVGFGGLRPRIILSPTADPDRSRGGCTSMSARPVSSGSWRPMSYPPVFTSMRSSLRKTS